MNISSEPAALPEWQAIVSGNAQLSLSPVLAGRTAALRMDFDFKGGGGFVVARRAFKRAMPEEYCVKFRLRGSYVFMDKENYEQLSLQADFLEGQAGYLLPNTDVQINFYNGRAIGVEIPPSVILTVVDTEPGIKNATATNTFKPAKMETGITVQVPPFINKGERIKVDTAEGTYMERA